MKEPIEVIDELAEQSLAEDQSKQEWLDYLLGLRDQINMSIECVQEELGL